ncbi:MAG: hypothetical protein GY830_06910 [Bacteroidetes bacterium]|nr:hypothetical protein [Bacteroidota bacterium]
MKNNSTKTSIKDNSIKLNTTKGSIKGNPKSKQNTNIDTEEHVFQTSKSNNIIKSENIDKNVKEENNNNFKMNETKELNLQSTLNDKLQKYEEKKIITKSNQEKAIYDILICITKDQKRKIRNLEFEKLLSRDFDKIEEYRKENKFIEPSKILFRIHLYLRYLFNESIEILKDELYQSRNILVIKDIEGIDKLINDANTIKYNTENKIFEIIQEVQDSNEPAETFLLILPIFFNQFINLYLTQAICLDIKKIRMQKVSIKIF